MHILIGILLGVILLWGWLIGHWFARVLVFLMLATLGVLLASGITIALILAVPLSWPLASLPIYYRRHQLKATAGSSG